MNLSRMLNVVLMIAVVTLFTSCDSDEVQTADIVGEWTISGADMDITIGEMSITDYFVQTLGASATEAQLFQTLFEAGFATGFTGTIEFKDDNTYASNIGGDVDDGTWTISSGDTNLLIMDAGTIDEGELIIKSVTGTTLVVAFEETEGEDFDDDGIDEEMALSITLTLTK